jgi:hypothetical protein
LIAHCRQWLNLSIAQWQNDLMEKQKVPPCLAEWHNHKHDTKSRSDRLAHWLHLQTCEAKGAPILSTQRGVLLSQRPRAG